MDTKQKYFSVKSGDLRLQLNRKEDIFHAEDITLCELLPNYEALIGIKQIGFKNSFFSTIGTKLEKKTVEVKGWVEREEAEKIVLQSIAFYKENLNKLLK